MFREPDCDRCHGTGWLTDGHGALLACGCLPGRLRPTQRALADRLSSPLPTGWPAMDFQHFEVPSTLAVLASDPRHDTVLAYDAVSNLVNNQRGLVTLCGAVGRGKTHLAVATYHAWRNAYALAPIYLRYADLIERRQQSFGLTGDDATRAQADWKLIRVWPWLIIDDLGVEVDSDWAAMVRYQLVDQRYNDRDTTATLITTNVDPQTLGGRVASRLMSREENVAFVVMRGADVRRNVVDFKKKQGDTHGGRADS